MLIPTRNDGDVFIIRTACKNPSWNAGDVSDLLLELHVKILLDLHVKIPAGTLVMSFYDF